MKMLKIASLASVMALGFASSTVVHAVDGTINFTGRIIDTGCNAFVNGSGVSTGNVNMGQVMSSAFTGVGSTATSVASTTGFTIELNDCPTTVTSVTFKFDGVNVNGNDEILALSASNNAQDPEATGVGIQLYDENRNVIQLAQASASYTIANHGTGTTNSLPFYAKYIQTLAAVTTGPANSVATFTVNY